MPGITLWLCDRCKLIWHDEDLPENCPKCLRRHAVPSAIMVAGRDLREFVLREYGKRDGLLDIEVRTGLDKVKLGICPHGYLLRAICTTCCNPTT